MQGHIKYALMNYHGFIEAASKHLRDLSKTVHGFAKGLKMEVCGGLTELQCNHHGIIIVLSRDYCGAAGEASFSCNPWGIPGESLGNHGGILK